MGRNSRGFDSKIAILLAAAALIFSCTPTATPEEPDPEQKDTTVVVDPPKDTVKAELVPPISKTGYKIATLWIDLTANIKKLRTKAGALEYLDKIQNTGFNAIVLDVKGTKGAVMYDTDFLYKAESISGVAINGMDYDYISFFIDECHKRDMRITISTCVMPMGDTRYQTDPAWKDLYCTEHIPSGIVDIRQDPEATFFLNPCLPEVKAYAVRMAQELVTKYDFDGYALDYCRYWDYNSDFSENTHKAFEKYIGETVEDWPYCVFKFEDSSKDRAGFTPGKYYNQFCEFKAYVITDVIHAIRTAVKDIKPNVDIEYWASAWWPCVSTGQNWASPDKDRTSTYWWGTKDYYKTGFAKELDIFQLGAYTSTLYGTGTESIQGLITQGKSLIRKNCQMYGTISAATNGQFKMAEACYMCLAETDGLMVFDLSHVEGNKWWAKCKKGIMQYRNEYENN